MDLLMMGSSCTYTSGEAAKEPPSSKVHLNIGKPFSGGWDAVKRCSWLFDDLAPLACLAVP